jgi:CrcB protein
MVGGGGFLGANLRYWLGGWIQGRRNVEFPLETMVVNLTGSFAIGLFLGLMAGSNWSPSWRLFLAIGLLGGYTTFSSFAWESLNLLQEGQWGRATLYVISTAVGTVVAAWIGLVIARVMLGGNA